MSSAEEDGSDGEGLYKRRRVARACDICRKKKVRCDGVQGPGKKCSNCTAFKLNCSYVETAKKRPPPKAHGAGLEERLRHMEDLLQRATGGTSPLGGGLGMSGPSSSTDTSVAGSAQADSPQSGSEQQGAPLPMAQARTRFSPSVEDDIEDSAEEEDVLLSQVNRSFKSMEMSDRFFGKSSGASLMKTAINLKHELATGSPNGTWKFSRLRLTFWTPQPWQLEPSPSSLGLKFPDSDLMYTLVDAFFEKRNSLIPLLHRPTFKQGLFTGLHLRDLSFATVVMGVCACASVNVDDPRVLLEGSESWHSAGWKYYNQMHTERNSVLSTPNVYDLQSYCLKAIFLRGSSTPQSAWITLATGLRLAQDMAAHRRKAYGAKPTVQSEQLKRAFWCLVFLDRLTSSNLGRPCAIQEEDYDTDLPVDCDDEYWISDNPESTFKQPLGKPSQISYFICCLKLTRILGFALRAIYSIGKSKLFLGFVGPDWEPHVISELDSMLNKWSDSIPDHLRWDPSREDMVHLMQSANLTAMFYFTQIMVHRPFMTRTNKAGPLAYPSLAICTNAARSAARLAANLMRRMSINMNPGFLPVGGFVSGIIILLNIWQAKRSGTSIDAEKEMELVRVWMDMAKMLEDRWYMAGRLYDVLNELSSFGDVAPAQFSFQRAAGKRARPADDVDQGQAASFSTTVPSEPSSFDHRRDSSTGSVDPSPGAFRATRYDNTRAEGIGNVPSQADAGFTSLLPEATPGVYHQQSFGTPMASPSGEGSSSHSGVFSSNNDLPAREGHEAMGILREMGFGELGPAPMPDASRANGWPSMLEMLEGVPAEMVAGPAIPGDLTHLTQNLHSETSTEGWDWYMSAMYNNIEPQGNQWASEPGPPTRTGGRSHLAGP